MEPKKMPKDLGLVLGSERQIMWEKVAANFKDSIKIAEDELIVSKCFLAIAEKNAEAEKAKFESKS